MMTAEIMEEYENVMKKGGAKTLDKTVYEITGDVRKLMDGLTSNTLDAPKNALLDRFGRCIVLFDQKFDSERLHVVIEKAFEKRFEEHISTYMKFVKAGIKKTGASAVHFINTEPDKKGMSIPQRIGHLEISEGVREKMHEMSDKVYKIIRMENNISVQGIDFDNEMFLNINWQEAVSFTKGCFLGQEVIARTHNLGKPPKRLARILYDRLPENVTSSGKEIGKITSSCFSPKYGGFLAFSIIPNEDINIDNGKIV